MKTICFDLPITECGQVSYSCRLKFHTKEKYAIGNITDIGFHYYSIETTGMKNESIKISVFVIQYLIDTDSST